VSASKILNSRLSAKIEQQGEIRSFEVRCLSASFLMIFKWCNVSILWKPGTIDVQNAVSLTASCW
jgi:hypothetical protein